MSQSQKAVTANNLLETLKGHPWKRDCSVCGKDCGPVALTGLIYRFEPCRCEFTDYEHLVETIYHEDCYRRSESPVAPARPEE